MATNSALELWHKLIEIIKELVSRECGCGGFLLVVLQKDTMSNLLPHNMSF
jgi:hypothetical protein